MFQAGQSRQSVSKREELWFSASEAEINTRKRAPTRATRPRSAITSGRQLFIDGDRFHDLILGHISDISAGAGANALSNAQLCLVRKAAAIECELERLDAALSRGDEVDMDSYARVAGHLRRMWETLGLERRQRDVTKSIDDLIKEEAARTRHQDISQQDITRQDIANDLVVSALASTAGPFAAAAPSVSATKRNTESVLNGIAKRQSAKCQKV